MSKYINLNKTIQQKTQEQAYAIIQNAVISCDGAIKQIKELAVERGGKAQFINELEDNASKVGQALVDLKVLIEKLSDLTGEVLE